MESDRVSCRDPEKSNDIDDMQNCKTAHRYQKANEKKSLTNCRGGFFC